jgi:hypothetical protein
MMGTMSPEPKPGVIGSLPRTRPHRRSAKRAAPGIGTPPTPTPTPPVDTQSAAEPAVAKAAAPKRAPAAKTAKPKSPRAAVAAATAKPKRTPAPKAAAPKRGPAPVKPDATAPSEPVAADPSPGSHGVVETAVQAAAELAEIGLHASARALRRAVSRLPRP